jgi:DNA repair protein RecN (Recombination protein N)
MEGADQAPSVLDHLAACEQELSLMEGLDSALQPLRQSCTDGLVALQDLARDLDRYGSSLESDPESLAALQERMALLKSLERRHGLDLAQLIGLRDQLREHLAPGGGGSLDPGPGTGRVKGPPAQGSG